MATVRWTERAKGDLQEVCNFIVRDSPRAADALVERIARAADRLAAFPESGRIMPEFPTLPYREVIVGNYRVLYRIERESVWIAAVVHGRRLLRAVE